MQYVKTALELKPSGLIEFCMVHSNNQGLRLYSNAGTNKTEHCNGLWRYFTLEKEDGFYCIRLIKNKKMCLFLLAIEAMVCSYHQATYVKNVYKKI